MTAWRWFERRFAGRAAFTLTFFVVAMTLWFMYRILHLALIFPGRPYLSIGVPAFLAALLMSFIAVRAMNFQQRLD